MALCVCKVFQTRLLEGTQRGHVVWLKSASKAQQEIFAHVASLCAAQKYPARACVRACAFFPVTLNLPANNILRFLISSDAR